MQDEKLLKNLYPENRIVLKKRLPLDMPLCVSIEPTNICNFKCVMCFHGNNEQDQRAKPLGNIDWGMFEKILSDLREWTRLMGGV